MALNEFIAMGRMTAQPELKMTQSGKPYCKFSIAIDRDYKDDQGNRPADFATITAWDKTAELICKHFPKGKMIAVKAKFRNNNWTDQQGNKRYDYYFEAVWVGFCGDSQGASGAPAPTPPPAQNAAPAPVYATQQQPQAVPAFYAPPEGPAPQFETITDDSELPF